MIIIIIAYKGVDEGIGFVKFVKSEQYKYKSYNKLKQ